MKQQNSIETGEAPHIVLQQIAGDLNVTGWEQSLLQVVSGEEIDIRVEENTLYVRCNDDCVLQVPTGASLEIHRVGGDAALHSVHGTTQVHKIGGDLRLGEMGALTIDQVGGDLVAQQIHGDLIVNTTLGGDAKLVNVQGNCRLTAGGDLLLVQIDGMITAEAGGDANLRLATIAQQPYQVTAGGDISCRLPDNANLTVQATCGGEVVIKRLPAPARRSEHELTFTLGTGETSMRFLAGGDIVLVGQNGAPEAESEWGKEWNSEFGAEFGAEFGQRAVQMAQQVVGQVERQMDHLTRHLDERLAHLGTSDEIAGRVQERVQSAMRKAEERIAEAMRHTEQRIREAEQRANERNHAPRSPQAAAPWRPVTPPQPPKAPTPPNDEERRMILRMVSEGKLSVEQADQLLAALVSPRAE